MKATDGVRSMLFAVAVLAFAMLHGAAQAEAQTYTNTINAPCAAGYPSCTVQISGGGTGTIYFSAYHQYWQNLVFSTSTYNGVVDDLPYTLTLTEGTGACNSGTKLGDSHWTLSIPQTNTTDGAGHHVTVSMTQYLTSYYASGRFSGCHYEVLNGTTTISVD
jgi:hypothetical protein